MLVDNSTQTPLSMDSKVNIGNFTIHEADLVDLSIATISHNFAAQTEESNVETTTAEIYHTMDSQVPMPNFQDKSPEVTIEEVLPEDMPIPDTPGRDLVTDDSVRSKSPASKRLKVTDKLIHESFSELYSDSDSDTDRSYKDELPGVIVDYCNRLIKMYNISKKDFNWKLQLSTYKEKGLNNCVRKFEEMFREIEK